MRTGPCRSAAAPVAQRAVPEQAELVPWTCMKRRRTPAGTPSTRLSAPARAPAGAAPAPAVLAVTSASRPAGRRPWPSSSNPGEAGFRRSPARPAAPRPSRSARSAPSPRSSRTRRLAAMLGYVDWFNNTRHSSLGYGTLAEVEEAAGGCAGRGRPRLRACSRRRAGSRPGNPRAPGPAGRRSAPAMRPGPDQGKSRRSRSSSSGAYLRNSDMSMVSRTTRGRRGRLLGTGVLLRLTSATTA